MKKICSLILFIYLLGLSTFTYSGDKNDLVQMNENLAGTAGSLNQFINECMGGSIPYAEFCSLQLRRLGDPMVVASQFPQCRDAMYYISNTNNCPNFGPFALPDK